jgi:hypothetical protein
MVLPAADMSRQCKNIFAPTKINKKIVLILAKNTTVLCQNLTIKLAIEKISIFA